jgi:phospholipase/lecithinase/hemolysin
MDPPSRVVLFSASHTDRGNMHQLTLDHPNGPWPPSAPYDDGRFCNGPLWHEHAGAALGWPEATASLLGGDDYAYGGAATGSGTTTLPCFPDVPIPTIGTQIETFLADNEIQPSDLFLFGLNNDPLFLLLGLDGGKTPAASVANMVAHVETLASAGARRLVVMNEYPLQAVPLLQGNPDAEQLTNEYNALLGAAMEDAAETLEIDIRVLDEHAVYTAVLDDPASFGITNTTDPVLVGNNICAVIHGEPGGDPDEYMWWDWTHSTTVIHELVGEALVDLLRCPADFNADGALNILDFVAFQGAFTSGDMSADCNDDGELNILDFVCFQQLFVEGCE